MTHRADLAVLGDGIAGLAAAITAARAGRDTILLSGNGRAPRDIPETLVPQALPLLGELGLDESLVETSFARVANRLSRWGLGPARHVPAIASVSGGALLLGKARLTELLRARAQTAGVRTIEAGRLLTVEQQLAGIELEVRNSNTTEQIGARFAIDATGRAAALAQSLGVRRRTLDNLVSFWIEGPAADEGNRVIGTVTVRDGWLFFAGRPDGRAVLGFFTAGSAVRSKPTPADIVDRIAFAPELRPMLADLERWRASSVVSRNAATTVLGRAGGTHWLACGDALQTVDPIGSNGIHTALSQGMSAAIAADAALGGDRRPQRDYECVAADEFREFQTRRRAYYGLAV